MNTIVLHYLLLWKPLGYLVVFVGMIFEGEGILFAAAFLTHRRYFDLGDIFVIMMAGALLGDTLWYWLGTKIRTDTSRLGRWAERLSKPLDSHLVSRQMRTLIISKFTYGLHHALLLRAGNLRLNFLDFLKNNFVATTLWVLAIGALGFFSSVSLVFIRRYLKYAEIALLCSLAGFYMVFYLVSKKTKEKI